MILPRILLALWGLSAWATGTCKAFGYGLVHLFNGSVDYDGDSLYIMFIDSTGAGAIDIDADDYLNDVNGDEVTDASWSAGGVALSGTTVTIVGASNEVRLKANDVAETSKTLVDAKMAIIYSRTNGTDATRELLFYINFDSALEPDAGDLDIDFDDTNGLVAFDYT